MWARCAQPTRDTDKCRTGSHTCDPTVNAGTSDLDQLPGSPDFVCDQSLVCVELVDVESTTVRGQLFSNSSSRRDVVASHLPRCTIDLQHENHFRAKRFEHPDGLATVANRHIVTTRG